jgi:hypothetical protein
VLLTKIILKRKLYIYINTISRLKIEENKASFLEHLLGKENLPLDSVYANITELMLSGLDTVCFFKL